ncbi:MAG: glycosyltransferase family 2 protein [Candidatus Eisenbacteria bacterium]|uniref:Glycosyltransferase family 2 protein n=1 Tax=Eiseniibacteriota bacterium TaxID=2212470 RepID=A0A849T2D5_UNCEI|nr:glycosyltransferase family 2 protein [Candidatus Eisenbacteria bacterium]
MSLLTHSAEPVLRVGSERPPHAESRPAPDLSVVIPLRDEAANVTPLLSELRAALTTLGRTFEIVLVDDASSDGTAEHIAVEAGRDRAIVSVRLEVNLGQSLALAAGFARAQGAIVVTLDGDLQNDPADLSQLLAALESVDVVSGVRTERHDRWTRRVASRIANSVRRAVLGDPCTDIGCAFKAYRREALEGLPMFVGVHRFLPALCVFRGARYAEIPVRHRSRRSGLSKYGVGNRLGRGLRDLIGVRWLKTRLGRMPEPEDRS